MTTTQPTRRKKRDMPKGWKEVKVRPAAGKTAEVPALVIGPFAVHKRLSVDSAGVIVPSDSAWTVTFLSNGFPVCHTATQVAAQKIARMTRDTLAEAGADFSAWPKLGLTQDAIRQLNPQLKAIVAENGGQPA